MAKFRPTPNDMRQTVKALERSEKKSRNWREEGDRYNGMMVNDVPTINAAAPGGDQSTAGRSETSTVYRNGIRFAVWAAIRRIRLVQSEGEALR
mgnify:CR=1 FL=1